MHQAQQAQSGAAVTQAQLSQQFMGAPRCQAIADTTDGMCQNEMIVRKCVGCEKNVCLVHLGGFESM